MIIMIILIVVILMILIIMIIGFINVDGILEYGIETARKGDEFGFMQWAAYMLACHFLPGPCG